jgi:hypothetical protein
MTRDTWWARSCPRRLQRRRRPVRAWLVQGLQAALAVAILTAMWASLIWVWAETLS